MDYKIKKQLLEKYWRGETSPEEEIRLRAIVPHLDEVASEEKIYFEQLDQFSELSLDETFDIDYLEQQSSTKTKIRSLTFFQNIRKIAAAALILLSLAVMTYRMMDQKAPVLAEEEDPQKAFELAKQSLMLISSKLNKGATYTYELEHFELLQEKVKTN